MLTVIENILKIKNKILGELKKKTYTINYRTKEMRGFNIQPKKLQKFHQTKLRNLE